MRFIYTKTFTKIFVVFVIIASIVILDKTGKLAWIENAFLRAYSYTTDKIALVTNSGKTIFQTLFTIRQIVSENAQLNQQINQLSFENARLKTEQDENLQLRQTLSFKQQSNLTLLPVEVLNMDPTGFSQTLTIDKGEDYQVSVGKAVVVAPGILIGRVTEVDLNSSQVTLITDPSSVVNAEVADSGAKGLVRGEHGLGLSLDLVTQNELIKTGDQVTTSSISNDFPPGLLIGEIAGISSSATELFQKASVASSADLRNLKFLFVVQ
jgi:rod shape-determining protein MreC